MTSKASSDFRTLGDMVTDEIRKRILTGSLAPGQRLVEDRLAEEFGVSRHPVREALRGLSADGLVSLLPRRRAEVATPSPELAGDLLEVVEVLEGLVARLACRRAGSQACARLTASLGDGEAMADPRVEAREVAARDAQFRRVLLEVAGNPVLADLLEPLRERIGWILGGRGPSSLRALHAERGALIAALEQGDEEWAGHLAVGQAGGQCAGRSS